LLTRNPARVTSDVDHLKADFDPLREASAVLRDKFARNRLATARARQNRTQTRADSQRLRGELFRVRLPREPTSAGIARRLLEEHLDTHRREEIDDAKSVVSELVNNAVVHGRGAIELRVSWWRGRVRIEVTDEGKDAAIRTGIHDMPHGLDIVEAVSLAWGAHEGSTHVWAELPVSTPARR
jgi:hypothetical protein